MSGSSALDCHALGKALASLNFTGNGEDMGYRGFTCDGKNSWNSSDPDGIVRDSNQGSSGGGAASDKYGAPDLLNICFDGLIDYERAGNLGATLRADTVLVTVWERCCLLP